MDYYNKVLQVLETILNENNSNVESTVLLSNIPVPANTSNSIIYVMNPTPLKVVILYVTNMGASSDLTVDIYGSADQATPGILHSVKLNASTLQTVMIPIDISPLYFGFVASNSDVSNATNYKVSITKGI